jgi:hypothetical protein
MKRLYATVSDEAEAALLNIQAALKRKAASLGENGGDIDRPDVIEFILLTCPPDLPCARYEQEVRQFHGPKAKAKGAGK